MCPDSGYPNADGSTVVSEEVGTEECSEETAEVKSPLLRALLHVKWASLLQKAGKYDRAEEHYANSLSLMPSARAHFGRGTCLAALRRRLEAMAELEKAKELCPKMVGAIINLAGVQLALSLFAEAEQNCREALRLEPDSREAVMNLANALRNLGRRTEAVQLVWQHIAVATGDEVEKTEIDCSKWEAPTNKDAEVVVVCLKWGKRYNADYVNRLCASARRRMPKHISASFVCFTEDPDGIDDYVETRTLPEGFPLWWGKAYLFSEDAGLDGQRVLFLDLDQVIVGPLDALVAYQGPLALLHTDTIACELASGGYNSSVISWYGSKFLRPLFEKLTPAVLRYVHRFDHWLEMMVLHADLWQKVAPGQILDYTTTFRAGRCLGCDESSDDMAGAFAAGEAEAASPMSVELPSCALVTFPRSPKPHEVLEEHKWIQEHWSVV